MQTNAKARVKQLELRDIWKKYNHLLFLFYYLFIGFLYQTFNKMIVPEYFMHSFLDEYIPFVKIFIIPYLFWYVYIFAALVYFGFTSKEDFYKLTFFMFGGMTICFLIYYILPNGQNLRPVITDTDLFSRMIANIYQTDNPTNVAPSMHVLDSIGVHLAVRYSRSLRKYRWLQWGSLISAFLISISTVLIKQHSVEDGLYAVLLSYILYLIIYRPGLRKEAAFQRMEQQKALTTSK